MSACGCSSGCTCGACRGLRDATPLLVENRPGLPAVRYRVGDHARFKSSLLTALSRARLPALRGLATRRDDDFSIALLDGFAVVADIFTFYQERIANEGFLRTATERLSIGHLAHLIGYELRPGSAAAAALAFQMMEAPGLPKGAPGVVRKLQLPKGTRVQSTPGPGQAPQTFETVEEIEARPAWNALAAATVAEQALGGTVSGLTFKGSALNLRPGDALLLVYADGAAFSAVLRVIQRVDVDARADQTRAVLQPAASGDAKATFAGLTGRQAGVFAFRKQAALFGYNAPNFSILNAGISGGVPADQANSAKTDWNQAKAPNDATTLLLDAVYPEVVAGGWAIWDRPDSGGSHPVILKATPKGVRGFSGFGLSGKGTLLGVEKDPAVATVLNPASFAELRDTTLSVQAERLVLATVPLGAPVQGAQIALGEAAEELEPGRRLAVSGNRLRAEVRQALTLTLTTDAGPLSLALDPGDRVDLTAFPVELDSGQIQYAVRRDGWPGLLTAAAAAVVRADESTVELAVLAGLSADGRLLTLADPLAWSYDPPTVRVNANVAAATHGEAVREVFEGGDARQAFQRFALKQAPITYVAAGTPSGTASTLRVWVEEVEWHEVPFLYGQGPRDRVFITRGDGDGRVWIQFGDGVTGARLPTGAHNVRAEYRRGLGAAGNLEAGQINLLMSRPAGLKDAANPLPSADGKDGEAAADARANAPLTVLTLDRVVSLQDYEDFARAFAGVAKATATWSWFGQARGVFITVAGPGGGALSAAGRQSLRSALGDWGDPHVPVAVENHVPVPFRAGLRVKVEADHQPALVLPAVEAALRASFSFGARAFGQDVSAAEVMAAAQGVPGVVAVQLASLHRADDTDPAAGLAAPLVAGAPLPGARGSVQAGELLTLAAGPLDLLEEMA